MTWSRGTKWYVLVKPKMGGSLPGQGQEVGKTRPWGVSCVLILICLLGCLLTGEISLIMVQSMGLAGVGLGTVVGMVHDYSKGDQFGGCYGG